MNEKDVEIVSAETVYKGYFRLDRYRLRHRKFDGGWSEEIVREVLERGHAAAVLLYDPEADRVVLIEQFRPGAMAAGRGPWQVEVVAGIIDEGETAERVVAREAEEEAGCSVSDLIRICEFLASPGAVSETIALYCGRIDSKGAGGVFGLAHEHEDIRVVNVPAEEAIAWADQNRIENAPALIALHWLARNRADLRVRWRSAP